MERRNFLKLLSSFYPALLLSDKHSYAKTYFENSIDKSEAIEKVFLIFKTHLDIGFTDLAKNVLERYINHFIPSALEMSKKLRINHENQRFIWTTGAWLIHEFLEKSSSQNRKLMESAIIEGDIVWHALPFTTHSELMDDSLFSLTTRISKNLDVRFGKKTIAAKMTDVPSHSIGIILGLVSAGVNFLHIGINPASTPPMVPPLFRWIHPDKEEINVMYQKNYGDVMIIPGTKTAVSINFTGDNHGPQSIKSIKAIYTNLSKRFPNAKIDASDLNEVAKEIGKIQNQIPKINRELGDTWIHGVGSDPWKIARFRELSRMRKDLIESGKWNFGDDSDLKFGLPLMMIAEHTWGLDVKSHLKDWDIYTQKDFKKARIKSNFQKMEQSWNEKRDYLDNAINTLPEDIRNISIVKLDELKNKMPKLNSYLQMKTIDKNINFKTELFKIGLDRNNGAINNLYEKRSDQYLVNGSNSLALFTYQTFSNLDYERFYNQYLTQRPAWAISDFGKPGIENLNLQSKIWEPTLIELYSNTDQDKFSIVTKSKFENEYLDNLGGSPQLIVSKFDFLRDESKINIDVQWFNKPACRLPEAMWLSFIPNTISSGEWTLDKMGCEINTTNIVKNGNRNLHGVIDGVYYHDRERRFEIITLDAPLVAPGKKSLLNFNNQIPKNEDGIHFCLYNNVWGTNFMMWFEENMRFRFQIRTNSIA